MGIVFVRPMPEKYRNIPELYRPRPGPIFRDFGPKGPSPEDRALARELFGLLDPESKRWYQETGMQIFKDLRKNGNSKKSNSMS